MNAARRLKTSVEVVFDDDAPTWLDCVKFTRDGDQILISIVKQNGHTYEVTPLCLSEFNELADTLLDP